MSRLRVYLALVALWPARVAAQDSTTAMLREAHELYDRLEIERAIPLFRQVVSPGWSFPVTAEQRIDAYKYLGALLVLEGSRDSATAYFRAAIERDPFADLDPLQFTPAQVSAFQAARRLTFAVATRPVAAERVDPRTERMTFTIVTTHSAALDVKIRSVEGGGAATILFTGESEGLREIRWDCLLAGGQLVPPGRYEFLVVGRSRLLTRTDSTRMYFDVRHELPALEDTLPALAARNLLPEHYTRRAAAGDLATGVAVAGGALLVAGALANSDLGRTGGATAGVMAGGALVAGVAAFIFRSRHLDVPQNVPLNNQRRAERRAANDTIQQRNANKIRQTVLVITPAAGVTH